MNELIKAFDVLAYLQDRGVSHSTSGENVSTGWVGVNCPFCDDELNHMGINLSSKIISCWKCGEKGTILKYIQRIDRCDYYQANQILKKFIDRFYSFTSPPKEETKTPIYEYMKDFKKEFLEIHYKFLRQRNFDPEFIIKKYDLYAAHMIGAYNYRLIIPIYMDFEIVSFVGRDVTGKGNPRYKNCPDSVGKIPTKSCLYNMDHARKDSVIVVEGPTDVWRMGDDTVALLGVQYTVHQVRLLSKYKRVFVMLDADAQKMSEKLANDLGSVIKDVEILALSEGDPGDLPPEEVAKLKYDLLLR